MESTSIFLSSKKYFPSNEAMLISQEVSRSKSLQPSLQQQESSSKGRLVRKTYLNSSCFPLQKQAAFFLKHLWVTKIIFQVQSTWVEKTLSMIKSWYIQNKQSKLWTSTKNQIWLGSLSTQSDFWLTKILKATDKSLAKSAKRSRSKFTSWNQWILSWHLKLKCLFEIYSIVMGRCVIKSWKSRDWRMRTEVWKRKLRICKADSKTQITNSIRQWMGEKERLEISQCQRRAAKVRLLN